MQNNRFGNFLEDSSWTSLSIHAGREVTSICIFAISTISFSFVETKFDLLKRQSEGRTRISKNTISHANVTFSLLIKYHATKNGEKEVSLQGFLTRQLARSKLGRTPR